MKSTNRVNQMHSQARCSSLAGRAHLVGHIRLLLLALLFSSCTGFAHLAAAAEADFSQPIDVSADRSEFNQKSGKQVLSGNVEIRQGTMLIKADSIEVVLKDDKLNMITGQGSPITFQQENELGELVTGSCDAISYDAVNGILTMTGNAELKQPKQELKSDSIVFNSINQSVIAEGGESGRVSITIQPPDRN